MSRWDWALVLSPLFITWVADFFTKKWALTLTTAIEGIGGFLHFALHFNPGAMLGLFSDLPQVLRVVTLSTGGAFLVCSYVIFQYLIPIRSFKLRCGMSFLLGGIIGNVTDRILYGHVVDFIVLGYGDYLSPVFNVADLLQWVGYGLILFALFKEADLIWPETNIRKTFWVNPYFQKKFSMTLVGVGLGMGLICAVFCYTYLRVTLDEVTQYNIEIVNKFMGPFIFVFMFIVSAFCFAMFALGKLMSHRIAGPIYAFRRFVETVIKGDVKNLKLRTHDEFRDLEEIAVMIHEHIQFQRSIIESQKGVIDQIDLEKSSLTNSKI